MQLVLIIAYDMTLRTLWAQVSTGISAGGAILAWRVRRSDKPRWVKKCTVWGAAVVPTLFLLPPIISLVQSILH